VTGSIAPKPARGLARGLSGEDLRLAGAALNTALDPQGAGQQVDWRNPLTGARGAFTPAGAAYPKDGRVCRSFRAEVTAHGKREELRGAACRDKTADWTLTEVEPSA